MSLKARWWLWCIYVAIWTTLLLLPVGTLNQLPGSDIPHGWKYFIAKAVHVMAYAIMAILSGWLRAPARFRWLFIFFVMAHATLTEHLQLTVGRGGELFDVGFDNVGTAIGIGLTWSWWVRKMKNREPKRMRTPNSPLKKGSDPFNTLQKR